MAGQAQVRLVQRDRPALAVAVGPAHHPDDRLVVRRPQAPAAEPRPGKIGRLGVQPDPAQGQCGPDHTLGRTAGRGNRSGAASTPAGTGSARTSTARSFTGGEYATVTAATRRRGHRSALGNDTHSGSRAVPSVVTATCAQVSTRLASITTAVPIGSRSSTVA